LAKRDAVFPQYPALRALRGALLRGGIQPHEMIGARVLARAQLETGIVKSANWNHERDRSGQTVIGVRPQNDGSVIFQVTPEHSMVTVDFNLSPKDFDLANREERLRFGIYRAFVLVVCGVPFGKSHFMTHTEDGRYILAPFAIACSEEDVVTWSKVRALWEPAPNK